MHRPLTTSVTHHLLRTLLPSPAGARSLSRESRRRAMGAKLSRASRDDAGQAEPDLFLVVGLGNPGTRYEGTRHNVGFMALDALAEELGVRTDRLQANAAVGRGRLHGAKLLLAKPLTFMNVSGEAVGKLARYYGVAPDRVLVLHDDLDTPLGGVRLRAKGGHGGQNGMRSIIQHLGTQEFPRVKIGISRPPEGMPVATYVLQNFSTEEQEAAAAAVAAAKEAAKAAVVLGVDKAVSGLRIDGDGKQVAPKGVHQNGKGVRQPGGKKPAAAAMAKHPQQQQKQEQAAEQAPQSAMAAAFAAAAAAKGDDS